MGKGIAASAIAVALQLSASVFAWPLYADEQVMVIRGSALWSCLSKSEGIGSVPLGDGTPALVIDGASARDPSDDLFLPFDGDRSDWLVDLAGHYDAVPAPGVTSVGRDRSRRGAGAALLSPSGDGLKIVPRSDSLFGSVGPVGDFTIDFWLYPANMENGEQALVWNASGRGTLGNSRQSIRCVVSKSKFAWTFAGFFADKGGTATVDLTVEGRSVIVPRHWTHQLIRYQADTGLLEYEVDGAVEAVVNVLSPDSREPLQPFVRSVAPIFVGPRFAGMVDELRIRRSFVEDSPQEKYPVHGVEGITTFIDLGRVGTILTGLDAEVALPGDSSGVRILARASDNPYAWREGDDWVLIGTDGHPATALVGRWVQVRFDLYPNSSKEATPVLRALRFHYRTEDPPVPPSTLIATPKDGAVELTWSVVPEDDLGGYLVYFGDRSRTYFGESKLGNSPLPVGQRNSIVIDGLENGRLYYFAVAAYDRQETPRVGPLSREVYARPERTAQ